MTKLQNYCFSVLFYTFFLFSYTFQCLLACCLPQSKTPRARFKTRRIIDKIIVFLCFFILFFYYFCSFKNLLTCCLPYSKTARVCFKTRLLIHKIIVFLCFFILFSFFYTFQCLLACCLPQSKTARVCFKAVLQCKYNFLIKLSAECFTPKRHHLHARGKKTTCLFCEKMV